jgi:2-oxoglutarate dehydrogenase E1 component
VKVNSSTVILAVLFCIDTALEFRQQFGIDTFVDLICYRKYGHNETDEPSYTQPQMYAQIAKQKNSRQLYAEQLIAEGILNAAGATPDGKNSVTQMQLEYQKVLEQALQLVRTDKRPRKPTMFKSDWDSLQRTYSHTPVLTGVKLEVLDKVVAGLFRWPESFHLNKKIVKQLEAKQQAYLTHSQSGDQTQPRGTVDWSMGELLAIGTLLVEGTPVRLSGQDSRRGTFSHRHSVLYDAEDGSTYIPLNVIQSGQEKLCVYNSPLSEAAVLGFDYGYSLEHPSMLIMWEAQFGDFVNGAQVIIDQFITSAETKWQRSSGIVLLLPHGSEGMGPEHSSARLERFLQSCAEDNIQVCNLTTPAQYFHALRRQIKRNFRKPLVIMSPKSLLRNKLCVSSVDELVNGSFSEVLDDSKVEPLKAKRLLLCSGKIYYDLLQGREESKRDDVAILRLEQFYPWPLQAVTTLLSRYRNAEQLFWVQEEPQNMGGWSFVAPLLTEVTKLPLNYVGRPAAASPAVGSLNLHKKEQEAIVKQAYATVVEKTKGNVIPIGK